jgi:hypothetical protein
MLRHTYRTVAADLKTDNLISHFLLGHAPRGISQEYIAILILASGPSMRDAQEKISARMLALLGLTFKTLQAEIAAGLVQSLQEGEGRALARMRVLARAQRASARARRGKPTGPHSEQRRANISAAMRRRG